MSHVLFTGVSKFKQAFSTGIGLKLLVRSRICCCLACLARDFSKCTLKVGQLI